LPVHYKDARLPYKRDRNCRQHKSRGRKATRLLCEEFKITYSHLSKPGRPSCLLRGPPRSRTRCHCRSPELPCRPWKRSHAASPGPFLRNHVHRPCCCLVPLDCVYASNTRVDGCPTAELTLAVWCN